MNTNEVKFIKVEEFELGDIFTQYMIYIEDIDEFLGSYDTLEEAEKAYIDLICDRDGEGFTEEGDVHEFQYDKYNQNIIYYK